MANRVTQVAVETLDAGGNPNTRVTQVAVETLDAGGNPNVRLTQVAVETLASNVGPAVDLRQTQQVLEPAFLQSPNVNLTQEVLEHISWATSCPPLPSPALGDAYGFLNHDYLAQFFLAYVPAPAPCVGNQVWQTQESLETVHLQPNLGLVTQVCLEVVQPASGFAPLYNYAFFSGATGIRTGVNIAVT